MKTHINEIGIRNFKIFNGRFDFKFAPITVLVGTNSSGKSSLIKSFQLLNCIFKDGDIIDFVDIEEVLMILGDFEKILNRDSKSDKISFIIPIVLRGIPDNMKLEIGYKLEKNSTLKHGELVSITITSQKKGVANSNSKIEVSEEIFKISRQDDEYFIFHPKQPPIITTQYEIEIDYAFFIAEFKRESEQIQKYKQQELGAEKEGQNEIHPEYGNFILNPKVKNIGYRPFFDRYPGFYNNKYDLIVWGEARKDLKYYSEHTDILSFEYDEEGSFNDEMPERTDEVLDWFLHEFQEKVLPKTKIRIFSFSNKASTLYNIYLNFQFYVDIGLSLFESKHGDETISLVIDNLGLSGKAKDFIDDTKGSLMNSHILKLAKYFNHSFVYDNIRYSIFEAITNFNSCYFIGSFRNEIQRSYSSKQNSEFQALIKKILKKKETDPTNKVLSFIKKCLTRLEIGHEFDIVKDSEGQGLSVYIYSKGQKVLLADLGYGISQVLPLIFKIVSVALEEGETKMLFIEEPESNLHPALQSKLAELIVEAANYFDIQFVIETHSEYFIRKMQVLTANSYIPKNIRDNKLPSLLVNDTVIYYFNHPDKIKIGKKQINSQDQIGSQEQIFKINIEKDGALSKNFGIGFFDESSLLNLALYKISRINKN